MVLGVTLVVAAAGLAFPQLSTQAFCAPSPHFSLRPATRSRSVQPRCAAESSDRESIPSRWRRKTAPDRALESLPAPARSALSLGGIVAIDVALRRIFLARAISFPSSLAGMLWLFVSLCATQLASPATAERIFSAAKPGCAVISKWLACFFVPNLVLLPLVLKMGALDAARLSLIIAGGALVSLPAGALVASAADAASGTSPPATTSATTSAKPAGPPFLPSTVSYLRALSLVSGACAAVSSRVSFGAAAPLVGPLSWVCMLSSTLYGFVLGSGFPAKVRALVHPLITCTLLMQAAVGALALATARPVGSVLRSYLIPGAAPLAAPGNALLFMLGPATLSFGFNMFERRKLMRASAAAVAASTTVASVVGLFGTAAAGRLLSLSDPLRLAALPRQCTAPLAIAIANILGADPSLAATIVVVTGLGVANFGAALLDQLKVSSPVARGLAMGGAGHGLATAAMASEKEAFPFAAIAMALNGAMSTILVSLPAVRSLLLAVAGA